MLGGVRVAGWATILASVVVIAGSAPASAADLGGNCCADLEERIAELEATTARKGNRKVSLTVSGWVNEAVFAWDDGSERNVYVGTNSLEQSRFRFNGDAKINGDVSAGYILEVGIQGNPSNQWDQNSGGNSTSTTGTSQENALVVRKSAWYLKSKTYGQLSVGQNGSSTYHLLDDADAANTRNYSDAEAAAVAQGAFLIRLNNGTLLDGTGGNPTVRWSNVLRGFNNATPGQDGRRNIVRYDSPEFSGFTASASWGADDLWDTSLTYKGEISGFKVLGKVGYGESTDNGFSSGTGTQCGGRFQDFKCTWWGAAGTLMHTDTGVYLYGGYGEQQIETPGFVGEDTSTTWFLQPGIEKKWTPLGKTTVFGEYRHDNAGASFGNATLNSGVPANSSSNPSRGADIDFWAAGVVQNIESAAMDLYIIYRHADGEFVAGTSFGAQAGTTLKIDDFDMIITGARIQF